MSAQQLLLQKYGPPDDHYLQAFCFVWEVRNDFLWFPTSHFLVNKDFKDMLFKAFTALVAAGLHTEIKTYDGCYNDRSVRGSQSTSLHAWAAALDINAATNGMVVNPTPEQRLGTWTQPFIDTMVAAGLSFGGSFHNRADPMHWGLYDG
ncbi:MAG TPA: M15 family metallopeptidase [Puia sp.]|jgi:hypothetical protein|nr:M15 family metallopeptidase [Puia sp.]